MASLEITGSILKCIHDNGTFEEVIVTHIVKFYGTNRCCLEIKTTSSNGGVTIKFEDQARIDNALIQMRGLFP